ncbi:hypothetical protein D3C73_1017550 [compost metagenome]
MLLQFADVQLQGDTYVLTDQQGKQLPLTDIAHIQQATTYLLPLLKKESLHNQAMLVMFEHDLENNRLSAQPLSIVTAEETIRLLY